MRATMPVSRWLKWKAYERYRGPINLGVRMDFYAAMLIALHTQDRDPLKVLPPWARPGNYAPWMLIPEEYDETPDEFEIE